MRPPGMVSVVKLIARRKNFLQAVENQPLELESVCQLLAGSSVSQFQRRV